MAVWTSPGLFESWGIWNRALPADQLGALAAAWGFGWVAIQDSNEARTVPDALAQIRAKGISAGVWLRSNNVDANSAVSFWSPDFFIANVEGGEGFDPVAFRSAHPGLATGVVTNFGGIPNPATGYTSSGIVCLPEAYSNENPQATVGSMIFEAKKRGWAQVDVYPVIGVWGGYPAGNYCSQIKDVTPRPSFSVYLAEGMLPRDFQDLANCGLLSQPADPSTAPPPPPPPDGPPPSTPDPPNGLSWPAGVLATNPLLFFRFNERDMSDNAVAINEAGTGNGRYRLGTPTTLSSGFKLFPGQAFSIRSLQCCDRGDRGVSFQGRVGFGPGNIPLSGEPQGCIEIPAALALNFLGLQPFTVAFWCKIDSKLLAPTIRGAIVRKDPNTGANIYLSAGICGTRHATSAPDEGWAVYVQGDSAGTITRGSIVFSRGSDRIGVDVFSLAAPLFKCPPSNPEDLIVVTSVQKSVLVFCVFDGVNMRIYTSLSLSAYLSSLRRDPWLVSKTSTTPVSGPTNPLFTIGTVDFNDLVGGYWGNWITPARKSEPTGEMDDLVIWSRALTLDEILKHARCFRTFNLDVDVMRKPAVPPGAPNNMFERARVLDPALSRYGAWDLAGNSTQPGGKIPVAVGKTIVYRTTWFTYLAPRNGMLTLDTIGSVAADALSRRSEQLATFVAVFTGTSIDALTEVGATNDASIKKVSVPVVAGTTYRVQVGTDIEGANGTVVLNYVLT